MVNQRSPVAVKKPHPDARYPKFRHKNTFETRLRESFREIFRELSQIFRGFRKFFRGFRTCSDLFGCIRMHSDASGCVRMRSDTFGNIRKNLIKNGCFCIFVRFFKELCKNGCHQQLPRHFLPQINLFGGQYDLWSSSWERVPSLDGLCEHHWPAPRGRCEPPWRLCRGGGVVGISSLIFNGKE